MSSPGGREGFGAGEGVELAYALVEQVARSRGIRVLMVKGPMAAEYGLRAPRSVADADVLVEPRSFESLYELLLARGWHPRVARESPRFLEWHSRTLIHDSWPCDIDLHRYFPGFFSDPADVFEALWKGRRVRGQRNAPAIVPSKAGMAVIVALHALRSPAEDRSRRELESVVRALREEFSAAEVAEFMSVARAGRASWVLRSVIDAACIGPLKDDAHAEEKSLWERNQMSSPEKSAALWLSAVFSSPLRRIPRAAFHAIWVRRDEIPRNDGNLLPSRSESLAFQISRWRRGIAALRRQVRRRRTGSRTTNGTGPSVEMKGDQLLSQSERKNDG